ncbi:ABC-three component system protein [Aeromonas hydrophila]|uniref:ABC-three component system protein n=1 Tax=Aeromonas hydrophila TaxID=644 RepID=UPI00059D8055|nr:ABC-three component system protein [Aeromonas hydrophila]HAT1543784.1 alpha/beta hydrolase [Aeromonas hydrophila]HAT1554252.1 alpha/beta hydrolase [Aeromonas hydrophila]
MDNIFSYYKKSDNCNNLILFIHGFTGDARYTWENKNGNMFPQMLLETPYIQENFDVASYSYFTTLLDTFAKTKERYRWIKSIISNRTHVKERNLDIDELSNILRNHLRITLSQYDNIYIIAHSMGGLITKSLISNEIRESGYTKIKLFLSLAVPHQGSDISVFGGMISGNLQIDNLNPVNEFINRLNQRWVNLESKPTTKYFYGSYDVIVTKHSAVAIDNIEKDIISVAADHNSISKPETTSSIVYNAVVMFIKESHKHITLEEIGYQKPLLTEEFNDERFVLKLIIANIADDTRDNAKELFFNAEYASRLFKSSHDRKQFKKLYDNIRQLYKDSYDRYLADPTVNSGILLSEVHTKITEQDSSLLKSMIPTLQSYHKKGMLHQLANDLESDIWWSKDRDLNAKDKP